MNEYLSPESISALAQYRLDRAKNTLAEVPTLKDIGYYSTAINRMYYACYYAASALLVLHHHTPNTHAGVKQLLGLHFVATGIIPKELGRYYSILFERRHSSDYDDFVSTDLDEIDSLYPKAEGFIKLIDDIITQKK